MNENNWQMRLAVNPIFSYLRRRITSKFNFSKNIQWIDIFDETSDSHIDSFQRFSQKIFRGYVPSKIFEPNWNLLILMEAPENSWKACTKLFLEWKEAESLASYVSPTYLYSQKISNHLCNRNVIFHVQTSVQKIGNEMMRGNSNISFEYLRI